MPPKARRENAAIAYILVVAAFVLALHTQKVSANSSRTPFLVLPSTNYNRPSRNAGLVFSLSRGGAIEDSDDEYDLDESDFEEEYDSEEEDDVKLSASAVAAARKAKLKEAKRSKKTVSNSLKKKEKKRDSPLKNVPYIVKAILNPFTVLAMTRGYFASLFNIDYMKQDTTQDLRSALQDKAKKSGSSGGKKRARKMKPGQAKTLSDLPVLNA